MLKQVAKLVQTIKPAPSVEAHCDGPCGVYDPADARIKAEAVLSMTKKILALPMPEAGDTAGMIAYNNTIGRFTAIKEDQAHKCKQELLVLWTDFFKPEHLKSNPDLHDVFWKAAKLCSSVKVNVSQSDAEALMDACENIHNIFWTAKGRDVPYYTAS